MSRAEPVSLSTTWQLLYIRETNNSLYTANTTESEILGFSLATTTYTFIVECVIIVWHFGGGGGGTSRGQRCARATLIFSPSLSPPFIKSGTRSDSWVDWGKFPAPQWESKRRGYGFDASACTTRLSEVTSSDWPSGLQWSELTTRKSKLVNNWGWTLDIESQN